MILGITGTIGAGKGTVVDYLKQERGFAHYSVRDFLIEEIMRRSLPVNRDSMRDVANAIRAEHDPAHIVEKLFARVEKAGGNAIIESIRAVGEAEFLKLHGARIIAVDADRHVRYERIVARNSVTDSIDFATFVAQEAKELESEDPAGQHILAVMKMADYRLENDGTIEQLHQGIEEMLRALGPVDAA